MLLSPSPTKPYLSPFSPIPKTLILQNPLKSRTNFKPNFIVHCSTFNSQTRTHSAIQRIAEKLRSLGYTTEQNPKPKTLNSTTEAETKASEGEIFIPLPNQLAKYRVGHTLDPSWSTPENPVPRPGSGNAIVRYHELRKKAEEEKEERKREEKGKGKVKVPTLAELSLSEAELRRLTTVGIAEKRKLKVGKAGITEGIVNGIHERWRRSEVVKIVCEDICRFNMKRTHDLLERKTGGLVVWRVGTKIVLYRGVNYKYPYFVSGGTTATDTSINVAQDGDKSNEGDKVESSSTGVDHKTVRPALIQGVGVVNRVRFQLPGEAQLAEEADSLLEGLGPRFNDWWGYEPLPIDADLLPAVVPGYQKPFRLLPYGVKPILTNDEMTTLKRLGRPLPCHFALGRNRKHQGLAAAIVKLWEKCEIAKIAVKRGVQNTNSQLMAEELKWLTGGVLLSRDREFIVLYRGKDFLPSAVSYAIKERRKLVFAVDKEKRDHSTSEETEKEAEVTVDSTTTSRSKNEIRGINDQNYDLSEERKLKSTEAAIKRTSIRLSVALEKKAQAEKLLAEIENSELPQQPEIDKEGITEEERYMLRKIGLKMKPFLLMGRRGVFDGTVENMHLHWKYRELVKIISNERSLKAVHEMAQTLEAESGGILVAVEIVSKGYAIVVYRGKNYQRPARLRPPTLLGKKEALKRSKEAQRRQSLKLHVLRLTRNINDLKLELAKDEEARNKQSSDEVEDEIGSIESAIHVRSDSDQYSDNHSCSDIPSHYNENENVVLLDINGTGESEPAPFSESASEGSHAPVNSIQPAEQTNQTDPSLQFDGVDIGKVESEFSSESVNHANQFAAVNGVAVDSTPFSNSKLEEEGFSPLVSAEHRVPKNKIVRSTLESSVLENSVSAKEENRMPSSTIHLSNKDRLMLRKQALKMKKRPVLAVGRSNIVTGVAKVIKAHFKNYPLAIVNVKGRAKGTSVQEVVFQLEQATGGVLVSQEPTKIILYRGWGAFDEQRYKGKKNAQDAGKTSVPGENRSQVAVSFELMEAIRLECGLQNKQEYKQSRVAEN
ncbi:CRM-domain containing factor CFM2, chloroplastic isoform X2 [Mercurialis annua]|uniref:CRM-domain containing factor CFM2, chloroplastic isoform X2 n=1 Tax=Mercurialis annua TaxID=3986 RepID=UPI00215F1B77|nr:CRM-domain containing factor CFM2, chloroplastic isoform X2 [Mercurialis annua]